MIKVGITGGIGSGKTIISNIFKTLGYSVFSADYNAKLLLDTSLIIQNGLIQLFGKEIINNKKVNRKLLAQLIFNSEKYLKQVNNLIHPQVIKNYNKWVEQNMSSSITFLEAAILFESNIQKELDFVITISAPIEIRTKRVMERDKNTLEQVLQRMRNQISDEERALKSDFEIINDDKTLLLPQILLIEKQLLNRIKK